MRGRARGREGERERSNAQVLRYGNNVLNLIKFNPAQLFMNGIQLPEQLLQAHLHQ